MSPRAIRRALGALAALIIVLALSLYSVSESEFAVRTAFGQMVAADDAPGLHWRWPWPFNGITRVDRRVLTGLYQGETFQTADQRGVVVDYYIKWRITDPLRFVQSYGASEDEAGSRLAERVKGGVRANVALRTLAALAGAERAVYPSGDLAALNGSVAATGLAVVDVRATRIEPAEDVSTAIYQRMREAINALAARRRSEGAAAADRIRSEADRKRAELLAAATRDAQRIRGNADAEAAAIYARAYGRNADFAAFWQSMQAYRQSLGREGDVLVLTPEGDFFKFLHSAGRR